MPYLRLLGGAVLEDDDGGVLTGAVSRRHPLALLALLSATRSRTLSRGKLVGLLWPDSQEKAARNRLNTCIYRIRNALGDDALLSVGTDVQLNGEIVTSDVAEFEAALAEDEWGEAVRSYGGDFLDGFRLGGSPPFEKWVDGERARLRRAYLGAMESLAEAAEASGDVGAAADWWRRRAREDPYDSRIAVRLMEALEASGNPAEALRVARVHRTLLEEELGTAPGAEVVELAEEIREAGEAGGPEPGERTGADGDGAADAEGRPEPPVAEEEAAGGPPPRSGALRRSRRLAFAAMIGLGLLAGAAVSVWYLVGPSGEVPVPTRRTVAVMPFTTEGREQAGTLAEGMYSDVLARLSTVPGLQVVSGAAIQGDSATVGASAGSPADPGAMWLLQSRIRRSGERVTVRARLVESGSGREVWSEEYGRELTARNAFEIQEELTREIVGALESRLDLGEGEGLERAPPENLLAYRLYTQGRALLKQRTGPEMRQAVDHFRRAIRADSSYAPAWAGLADAVALLDAVSVDGDPPAAGRGEPSPPEAARAARRALELNPRLAEAHASLGLLYAHGSRGPEAVEELQTALRLRPGYAPAHHRLALVWLSLSDPEGARDHIERAVELDPLAPAVRVARAAVYLSFDEEERALADVRRAREIQPGYSAARVTEGAILYHMGRLAEARSTMAPLSTPEAQAVRALILAASGDFEAAREVVDHPSSRGTNPFYAGLVLAAVGETDAAFRLFGRVGQWCDLSTTPAFRYFFPDVLGGLRRDPRYARILRAVNRHWGLEPDGSLPAVRPG